MASLSFKPVIRGVSRFQTLDQGSYLCDLVIRFAYAQEYGKKFVLICLVLEDMCG